MITTVALGDGVGAAFTGRAGGVSRPPYDSLNLGGAVGDDSAAVLGNRRRAAEALGVDPARTVFMRQVHGADVAFVTSPDLPGPVDAVVTTVPGLALAVLVADCAPVLLADPAAGVVGAAHSGRPGTAAGVVPALVEAMCDQGADPARMTAAIGPAACGRCYEGPAEMRDGVAAVVPAAYSTTSKGTPGLDIRAGVAAQLASAGVTAGDTDPRCTIEHPDLFSYRREGRTGRLAGYIWLKNDSLGHDSSKDDALKGGSSAGGSVGGGV
ncbi:peptidoglycan editing factor PgeF [Actinomadura sp. BRA 177]|uniref:peptidoglycan editing factor PgeF n=1 Tax=Actinomadura sp. BRA 177 TaxID=2745202 RepID=UPI0015955C58|nr:peptidoglycan editing factor PgeF [Actinomadura sp. BRA 177]NVI91137.1 peptidoglycan editing factor PgeF [Actinomadura sp. BRA 177]